MYAKKMRENCGQFAVDGKKESRDREWLARSKNAERVRGEGVKLVLPTGGSWVASLRPANATKW